MRFRVSIARRRRDAAGDPGLTADISVVIILDKITRNYF